MFLAHLVGDYILQWDSLATWKSRSMYGVIAHSLVVTAVTALFALPFAPFWWTGILFISSLHFIIDAVQLQWKPALPPLLRFTLDQLAHIAVIIIALIMGGFMTPATVTASLAAAVNSDRFLLLLTAYAFITMPAWVLIKFVAYGLVKGTAPDFPGMTNKYIGILERLLIATFVGLGQFILVPLVTAPRFLMEWPNVARSEQTAVYLVELLASITIAVLTGILISQLW
jgi:hypothetical protein